MGASSNVYHKTKKIGLLGPYHAKPCQIAFVATISARKNERKEGFGQKENLLARQLREMVWRDFH